MWLRCSVKSPWWVAFCNPEGASLLKKKNRLPEKSKSPKTLKVLRAASVPSDLRESFQYCTHRFTHVCVTCCKDRPKKSLIWLFVFLDFPVEAFDESQAWNLTSHVYGISHIKQHSVLITRTLKSNQTFNTVNMYIHLNTSMFLHVCYRSASSLQIQTVRVSLSTTTARPAPPRTGLSLL